MTFQEGTTPDKDKEKEKSLAAEKSDVKPDKKDKKGEHAHTVTPAHAVMKHPLHMHSQFRDRAVCYQTYDVQ